ncbi:unnamed protein product [Paramecium primaurelia]|uniref:Uncharacterized protein n=1 Tax=Paramecium primaurelia TaxID=5886 RepID=A0A8S1KXF1_PARPR|nr:unnamed protein product [Paramecium primaurelia]
MRQQISTPTYGVGYKTPFSLSQQGAVKLVSQPSFQNQVQPLAQQQYQQQQQSYPQQFNRQIYPINGNTNMNRGTWEQQGAVKRFQTSQGNGSVQSQLQVVDLQQVEEPWKIKVQELQNRIQELESQQQSKQDNEDEESELSQAYSQIQQLVNTIKILQDEIQQIQEKLEQKQNIIDSYDRQIQDKDKEIEEANQYIQELHGQLEEQTTNVEEKHKYLFDEVNTWKKKFIEQNKEFHQKQEELMILQAELDNLKNAQIIIGKSSDYKQQK